MELKRRAILATLGAGAVAGCLGGGEDGDEMPQSDDAGDGGDGAEGGGNADDAGGSDDVTVQVRSHSELGDILVGPEGRTLYNFDMDTQGSEASSCYDDCADAWPALTAEGTPVAGSDVTAELTAFERDDGAMQVAANGWPLYYFASDAEPGDTAGQGINDVWWVLDPSGTPIRDDGSEDGEADGSGSDGSNDDDDSGGGDGPGGSYSY